MISSLKKSNPDIVCKCPIKGKHFTECPLYVEPEIVKLVGIPHVDLLKALYWVFDFMDRAMISVYLIGDTAQAVKAHKDLYGDKIQVAIRRLEWESGARRIADAFATPKEDRGTEVEYDFNGVPVILYVLEDSSTLTNFDTTIYNAEYFKLPNPYAQFEKEFPWLK